MKDLTFGQYYPSDSVVHRMDARVKILLMILYIAAIFFISSYFGYAVTLIFILAFSLVSKVPITKILKSVKRITVILVITALLNLFFVKTGKIIAHWWIFTITDYGLNYAIMMALRLTFLVIGTTFLTLTTTPTELTDGLESLMTPLKYVKIPVHDIAVIMSIALRFIPTLMEETQKIMNAQKARGATFDTGHLHQRGHVAARRQEQRGRARRIDHRLQRGRGQFVRRDALRLRRSRLRGGREGQRGHCQQSHRQDQAGPAPCAARVHAHRSTCVMRENTDLNRPCIPAHLPMVGSSLCHDGAAI